MLAVFCVNPLEAHTSPQVVCMCALVAPIAEKGKIAMQPGCRVSGVLSGYPARFYCLGASYLNSISTSTSLVP